MDKIFEAHEEADLQRRHAALAKAIRNAGLSQYVVTSAENIYYLTAATFEPLERPFFLIVDAEGQRQMLVPQLEAEHMRKAWGLHERDIHFYREFPAPAGQGWSDRLLGGRLAEASFAFDDSVPSSIGEVLKAAGGTPMDLLGDIRMIKSDWEVAQVERAARYADWGIEQILRASWNGGTVAETYAPTQSLMRKIIREVPDWDVLASKVIAAAWPAPLSAEPHAIPRLDARLAAGPHVAMVLTRVNGYAAESERTFFTAPPSPEERERFALVLEARRIAFGLVRPGVSGAEIDTTVSSFLGNEGFSEHHTRLHRCGHGVGLGTHEPPWIAAGSPHVLATNMIISIEPGIYLRGVGGYRHSDTVLVTNDGYRSLTRAHVALDQLVVGRKTARHRLMSYITRRTLGLGRRAPGG
ncbi:Xaa-Pro dipeptidase [Variovorax boronicumulans]|uniref:M24 family metallopeptidase n=1 Tax=Variovorax boronicumulans TaxID=436515 RepID=UPI00277F5CE7|nr:Xaa-Pro peptidase family protein [Variovorax boronicumulans]MDQ0074430.1 Xaa-Pro dipeptidase [Variovorax boronicumulans]